MDTRTVVTELVDRLGRWDPAGLAAMYADEVDWRLDWPMSEHDGPVPWIRPRSTRADVEEHYRTIASHHDHAGEPSSIDRLLVDREDAVVLGTIRNTVAHNRSAYEAPFALHLTVRDGLIVRHHIYEDSLSVYRAWGDARPG